MKDNNLAKKRTAKVLAVLLLVAVAALAWLLLTPKNYAQEVASPIEQSLIKEGAVKQGGGGNDGRGIDNRVPYYDSSFTISKNREETLKIVNKVATENGYSLKQGSPQDRGWLGAVADVYIENWYFDTNNKSSPYSDLEAGEVKLAFKLGDEDNPDPENSTTVRLSVKLPSFKN